MLQRSFMFLAVALLAIAPVAYASGIWDAGGANTNFATPENWSDDTIPDGTQDLVFGTGTQATLDSAYTFGQYNYLYLNSPNDFLINGAGSMTFDRRGITLNAPDAHTYTINVPVNGLGSEIIVRGEGYNGGTLGLGSYGNVGAPASSPMLTLYMRSKYNLEAATGTVSTYNFTAYNGTTTVKGTGYLETGRALQLYSSDVVLDYSTDTNDRMSYVGISAQSGVNTVKVVGNPSSSVMQWVAGDTNSANNGSLYDIVLVPDATTPQSVFFTFYAYDHPHNNGSMFRVSGTNYAGSSGAITLAGQYYGQTVTNDVLVGWLVGNEFATQGSFGGVDANVGRNAILPLSSVGRPALPLTAGAGTENVLMSTDTSASATLTGDVAINTVKIDGNYGVNLDGHNLSLTANGIIQVGTGNSQGITNGVITPLKVLGDRTLYISNDSDLLVSATVDANRITKVGPGKLIYAGAGMGMNWLEGSLELRNNTDITMGNGNAAAHAKGAGSLTINTSNGAKVVMVAGEGTVSFPEKWNYTGGTEIINGTLQFGDGSTRADFLGGDDITVRANGVLDLRAQFDPRNPEIVLDGGTIKYAGRAGGGFSSNNVIHFNDGTTSTIDFTNTTAGVDPIFATQSLPALTGSGTFVKKGAQWTGGWTGLALSAASGASSFSGNIDIQEGVLSALGYGYFPANVQSTNIASGAYMWFATRNKLENTRFTGSGKIVANNQGPEAGSFLNATDLIVDKVTFAPGTGASAGILTSVGNLVLADTAGKNTLKIKVIGGGAVAGTDYDQLIVGEKSIAGYVPNLDKVNLNVTIAENQRLVGDTATILINSNTCGTALPAFASVSFANYAIADVNYSAAAADTPMSVTLTRMATAGDGNRDGYVNGLDLSVMISGWYQLSTPGSTHDTGDFNHDGIVNGLDLSVMLANWNHGIAPGTGAGDVTPTPEPVTLSLLGLGALALLRKRRSA